MFRFRSGWRRRRGCSCLGGGGVKDVQLQVWLAEERVLMSGWRRSGGCPDLGEGAQDIQVWVEEVSTEV